VSKAKLREVSWKLGEEMCGKLGGALRASKMLRAATHMTTVRYETKPPMPFRIGRISDMFTLHSDIFILPPFGLARP
jgi:hypothetical protein